MITLEDFFALAKANPDMMQRYYKSVRAVMECLREEAKNSSGWWAKARLRKKQFTATYLLKIFPAGILFHDQPLSKEEEKLVKSWIIGAAHFHELPEEERLKRLEIEAARACRTFSRPLQQYDLMGVSPQPGGRPAPDSITQGLSYRQFAAHYSHQRNQIARTRGN